MLQNAFQSQQQNTNLLQQQGAESLLLKGKKKVEVQQKESQPEVRQILLE